MKRIKIICFMVIISSIVMLFYSCEKDIPKSPKDERVVVRFIKPTNSVVKEYHTSNYDVAGYKPDAYLDIIMTRSQFYDLLLGGYDVEITQTEESLVRDIVKKSEKS